MDSTQSTTKNVSPGPPQSPSIVVVATRRKAKATVLDHLTGTPHKVNYTPDYPLPPGFTPQNKFRLTYRHIGIFRCFKGHQDAVKLSQSPATLVLEDDALPRSRDWIDVARSAAPLLDRFEVVSLYGQIADWSYSKEPWIGSLDLLSTAPGNGLIKVLGSVAYLISQTGITKLLQSEFTGVPMDLFLCNYFTYALIHPPPFAHDRSQGSLTGTF